MRWTKKFKRLKVKQLNKNCIMRKLWDRLMCVVNEYSVKNSIIWIYSSLNRSIPLMKRQSNCQMPGACVLWDFMYISRVFPLFKNMNILKHQREYTISCKCAISIVLWRKPLSLNGGNSYTSHRISTYLTRPLNLHR